MQEQERGLVFFDQRFTLGFLFAGGGHIFQEAVDIRRMVLFIAHQPRGKGQKARCGVAGFDVDKMLVDFPAALQRLEEGLEFGGVGKQVSQGGLWGGEEGMRRPGSFRAGRRVAPPWRGKSPLAPLGLPARRLRQPAAPTGGRGRGDQDKAVLTGKDDRIHSQHTFHEMPVGVSQHAIKGIPSAGCSPAKRSRRSQSSLIVRFARQQIGQFKEFQLACGVSGHAEKRGVGVATAFIQHQQRAFGGGFDQGVVTLGGFVQIIQHFLALALDAQALLQHKEEQHNHRAGNGQRGVDEAAARCAQFPR